MKQGHHRLAAAFAFNTTDLTKWRSAFLHTLSEGETGIDQRAVNHHKAKWVLKCLFHWCPKGSPGAHTCLMLGSHRTINLPVAFMKKLCEYEMFIVLLCVYITYTYQHIYINIYVCFNLYKRHRIFINKHAKTLGPILNCLPSSRSASSPWLPKSLETVLYYIVIYNICCVRILS